MGYSKKARRKLKDRTEFTREMIDKSNNKVGLQRLQRHLRRFPGTIKEQTNKESND